MGCEAVKDSRGWHRVTSILCGTLPEGLAGAVERRDTAQRTRVESPCGCCDQHLPSGFNRGLLAERHLAAKRPSGRHAKQACVGNQARLACQNRRHEQSCAISAAHFPAGFPVLHPDRAPGLAGRLWVWGNATHAGRQTCRPVRRPRHDPQGCACLVLPGII